MFLFSPFRKSVICGYLLVSVGSLLHADNTLVPLGGENAIVGSIPGDQTRPHAALNSAGGFLVFQDNSITSLGLRIRAQMLSADMAAGGSPILVSSAAKSKTAGDQEKPHVALLQNGGAVVVWQGGKVGFQRIYARFLSATGVPFKSDIRVSVKTKLNQIDPVVATLEDGSIVIVWSSVGQDGDMLGIFARRFSSSGAPIGAEFQVNQFTANNQRTPSVASLTGGRFIIVWVSELQRSSASVDVYARVFDLTGVPTGDEFAVNSTTNNPCANPSVVGSAQGGFAVAWSQKEEGKIGVPSDPSDPTGINDPSPGAQKFSGTVRSAASWDVCGRFYDSGGNPIVGPSVLNTYTYGDQFGPSLSSIGTNYLCVWTSLAQDDDQREGVFGTLLTSDGQLQGTELHVNSTTVNRQIQPFVTSDGESSFLTLWSGFVKRNGFDLFSQVYQLSTP